MNTPERPKNQAELVRETIVNTVKNPELVLRRNLEKGCVYGIEFLIDVRRQLKNDSTYRIEGPDPDFRDFFLVSDDDVRYYKALIRMLNRGGHTYPSIQEGFFDFISKQAIADVRIRSVISEINELFNQAFNETFDQKSV